MGRPRKVTAEDAKTEGMVRCIVLRDYWLDPDELTGDEVRVRAGTTVEVTPEEAMDGLERNTLARVKE